MIGETVLGIVLRMPSLLCGASIDDEAAECFHAYICCRTVHMERVFWA